MKILIIGAGGREHALAEAYARSTRVTAVFVAPGNDFMAETHPKIHSVPLVGQLEIQKILAFVKKEKIDLVDVAQDEPLAAGVVDSLIKNGIRVFGPIKAASEIEWNKAWSREFMKKYRLPIPGFFEFSLESEALSFIKKQHAQVWYVKASGLAAGKGAIRVTTREEAYRAISSMKQFGSAGKNFLIEEAMIGEEFSLFALCDGENYMILGSAQDHKTAYNSDTGPNTGGMGCITPVGIVSKKILREVEKNILDPFIRGMRQEGRPYTGILYVGGMLTSKGVEIVEFNSRWGDPEAEVILPGLQGDYLDLVEASLSGNLKKLRLIVDKKFRISITGCAKGYPNDYSLVKNKKIYGLNKAFQIPGISIFGSGLKCLGKDYVVTGGRVFHLAAEGKDIHQARKRGYEAMSLISIEGNNLHYRTDIGWREVERGEN